MAIDLGYGTEKKILLVITTLSALAFSLMLIAVSTNYWLMIDIYGGVYQNDTQGYYVAGHSGLWQICRVVYRNHSATAGRPNLTDMCMDRELFSWRENNRRLQTDPTILDFARTETTLAIISLVLMLMSLGFAVYSLKQSRYIYKRLAGSVYLMSATCILVCLEVLVSSVAQVTSDHLPAKTSNISFTYGFSFILAWIAFSLVLLTGVSFLLLSKKRKGEKAYTESEALANEPMHLGRI